jgi:hypothetical protein
MSGPTESAAVTQGRGKWSKAGVPHKGWSCIEDGDLGAGNTQTCEMCESTQIRYTHTMTHPDYEGFYVVRHRMYEESNVLSSLSNQGVQMTVCRLSVSKTVLWMYATVTLIDPLREAVDALADVFDLSFRHKAVQPFHSSNELIIDAEVAINVVSVLVQEFQVLGVTGLLELDQELAQSVIQIPDVTRSDEIRKV